MAGRVLLFDIIRQKAGLGESVQDESDPSWWDEIFPNASKDNSDWIQGGLVDESDELGEVDLVGDTGMTRVELGARARYFWELECLVNSLDCLETTATIAENVKS
jgi:hypothetical protein